MALAPAAPIHSSQSTQSAAPAVPDLGKQYQTATDEATPRPASAEDQSDSRSDGKVKKRSLFGFGKKKTDDKISAQPTVESGLPSPPSTSKEPSGLSQASTRRSTAASPIQTDQSSYRMPSSPGRGIYSSSPHLASPATSQIFERDVQESAALIPNSPAIPSHIQTENHIPPVLDASSEAITDDHLNPDEVEIVTHTSHQPAAVTVTGVASPDNVSTTWQDELAALAEKEEAASNYGSLDNADVRRLSFISFADVVQAEQGGLPGVVGSRDSVHMAGLTSIPSVGKNRSPSPIRSPVSSQGADISPPTSKSGSVKGLEMSPGRKPLGSPTSTQHNLGASGELNVETMSQALRRTGSRDLSAVRSPSLPVSPIEGPGSR